MKVLIACEYSGTVRNEFDKLGHYAVSCDLLPTEIPGKHYQGNVLDILYDDWDLLIGHPPCTYLSYAALNHWNNPGRDEHRKDAIDFFFKLYAVPIKYICIENPSGIINSLMKPDQVIHPYYFGDGELKRTCFWLKNLPVLTRPMPNLEIVENFGFKRPEPIGKDYRGRNLYWMDTFKNFNKKKRSKLRSKTFPGIAKAMALQWSNIIKP